MESKQTGEPETVKSASSASTLEQTPSQAKDKQVQSKKEPESFTQSAAKKQNENLIQPSNKIEIEKRSVASRGVPSKETMFLPAHDSPLIRSFQDSGENITRNTWDLHEVTTFIFPKQYQDKYHSIASSFLALLMLKTKVEGTQISEFIKENDISKATFYNRVLPRLRRVGMIKIERQTIVAKESKRKFRPMTIHLSKTFGNYLTKIGDSWLALVDEAKSKHDQQKRLETFDEKK
ncbi:MAG: hypothetical protein WC492_01810 [Candidatus Micrarchaeia archaeon]